MRQSLSGRADQWAVLLEIDPCARGMLFSVSAGKEAFLYAEAHDHTLEVNITAAIGLNPLFPDQDHLAYTLGCASGAELVRIEWLGHSIRLYADGALADEDWPIGALPGGLWTAESPEGVMFTFVEPECHDGDQEVTFTGPMQYFAWPGNNTGVGDCMPFARDGRYCLYYLFDRRGHKSKGGLGAHQWAQISSADLHTWTMHPMALPITAQWEGSICTGSLIQKDGLTYAFYAVRMADGAPAQLTWATSKDGIRFEKSGQRFALTAPYEPVSVRDPMVFLGEDGQYHMLVTTSLVGEGRYGGCLAHLTSEDLLSWAQLPPFIVPGYADQPECSDYFEWNGWYYLVFSNFATARYRMSRQPFGPWMTAEDDVLDSMENQVPKTAAFGERRFLTGFLARYPRTYAGNAVTHELVQRADGTLCVRFVEEILPALGEPVALDAMCVESAEGRAERLLLEGAHGFRLRAALTVTGARSGLTLHTAGGDHRIDLERAAGLLQAFRPDEEFRRGDPRLQRTGLNFDVPIEIDMLVVGDILDAVIGGKALTMRLACDSGERVSLSAHAQAGALRIEGISLAPLA